VLILQFFALRFPPIRIDSVCIQVLSYPAGVAMARWLPTRRFRVFGYNFSFNPGPFNKKEHMLITVMANIGITTLYSSWIFEVQILDQFFKQSWARNRLYQYCISISMQCLGYGLAGLCRSCIVFADYCVWPANLATIVLNVSLHDKTSGLKFKLFGVIWSRYRYLIVLTVAYMVWYT
jgi:hypothetical protein